MPFHEREIIISNLEIVDEVIDFDDDKQGSCCAALEKIKTMYPGDEIIFCNGGDRKEENIPEMIVEDMYWIETEIGARCVAKMYNLDKKKKNLNNLFVLFPPFVPID